MTPRTREGISRTMQSMGRRYVQYINQAYRRTGTLWESRHKASLVDAENYLLQCYGYIELNLVRAGMVNHPGDYRWSSYRHNAYGEGNPVITQHEIYRRIGVNDSTRRQGYRALFAIAFDQDEVHQIRKAAPSSMLLGNGRFVEQIEAALDRSIGYAKRGRPKRNVQIAAFENDS